MNNIGAQTIEDFAKIARLVPTKGGMSEWSKNAVYKQTTAYGIHETKNPTI
jgi:hypothetical protein